MAALHEAVRRRYLLRNRLSVHYVDKFQKVDWCVYCGEPAGGRDHVFPIARAASLQLERPGVRRELGTGLQTVPCCQSCNSMVSDRPFTSILSKRRWIQDKLRDRYGGLFDGDRFTEEEKAELGRGLLSVVRRDEVFRARQILRMQWPPRKRRRMMNSPENSGNL